MHYIPYANLKLNFFTDKNAVMNTIKGARNSSKAKSCQLKKAFSTKCRM